MKKQLEKMTNEQLEELFQKHDIPKYGLSLMERQRSVDTPLG